MVNPFPLPEATVFTLPNLDQLRRAGWSVKTVNGEYCVAWRGAEEVVFRWRGGEWHQLARVAAPAAA